MKTRKIVEYHDNGSIFKEYFVNKNNEPHGLFRSWYSNGNPWDNVTFIKGKPHGSFKSLQENGETLSHGYYNHGQLDGMISMYYPSGNLNMVEFHLEGKMIKRELFSDEVNIINTIAYDLFCNEMESYQYKMDNFIGLFIEEMELNCGRIIGYVNKEMGELAPAN